MQKECRNQEGRGKIYMSKQSKCLKFYVHDHGWKPNEKYEKLKEIEMKDIVAFSLLCSRAKKDLGEIRGIHLEW